MPAETPAQPPRQQLAAHEMVAQLRQLFRRTHMSVVNEAADLIESLAAEVVALRAAAAAPTTSTAQASPDDIRADGWSVAVHNDYWLGSERWTFWLFTRDDRCAKGEGRTDAEALDQVRAVIAAGGGGGRGKGR